MRALLPVLGFSVLASALLAQSDLPALLRSHYDALKSAPGVDLTVSLQPLEGAPSTYTIKFAKPNRFFFEGGDVKMISDGTNVFRYSKSSNTYTQEPLTSVAKLSLDPRLWVWSPFFDAPAFVNLSSVRAGKTKTLRNVPIREVETEFADGKKAVFYMDDALGFARGASVTVPSGGSYIAFATQAAKKTYPEDDATFKFVAPPGAKKATGSPAAGPVVRFAQISSILNANCLPCHSAAQRRGGVDLTNFAGVVRIVKPGDPNNSPLIQYVTGQRQPRMPMGRGPLPQADIARLSAWIKAGAKN